MPSQSQVQTRRLIEDWLPISEVGIESLRERTPMTPFPAPNRLHVWWARRPLVASRAAVLASLMPADTDRTKFLHALGIHGDPMAAKQRISEATRDGVRLGKLAYGYSRAFTHNPSERDIEWVENEVACDRIPPVLLDLTGGGGSIPFEASRLGFNAIACDLNTVSWLILKATLNFPLEFGSKVLHRYTRLSREFASRAKERLVDLYPAEPESGDVCDGYLWARTIHCPYCNGLIPLSPNWRLSPAGDGVRLVPHMDDPNHRYCSFEMVTELANHSAGTVRDGDALCPFSDCARPIFSVEIKEQAQAGLMGQQLYTVIYKRKVLQGYTKAGKPKYKNKRGFRAPRPEDDNESQIQGALDSKMLEWSARNIMPDEEVPPGNKTDEPRRSGIYRWRDMFSPRQLFSHCTSVEVYNDLIEEIRQDQKGEIRPCRQTIGGLGEIASA